MTKLEKKHKKATAALLAAIEDLVECPNPADGEVDEGTRMMNRCMAAVAVVGDLPTVDAARILAYAAATIEEEGDDRDGCLSTLVGEAIRLQVLGHALEVADLERELDGNEIPFRIPETH